MATLTHTRGDTLPLALPTDAAAVTLQVHAAPPLSDRNGQEKAMMLTGQTDQRPSTRVH